MATASGSEPNDHSIPWRNNNADDDLDPDPSIGDTTDVELLKKAWRNEKASPEILQFQSPLVQRVREQIQLLEDTVDDFTHNGTDDLVVSLYQMDLDRTLFLLRSYLRIRILKIEKYMVHISKTHLWNRLSDQEQKFTKRCIDIMEKHLEQSVLSRLPDGYRSFLKQSVSSEDDDMGTNYNPIFVTIVMTSIVHHSTNH